ncbi:MAG: dTMP kinase, partial [Planctomycetota bacterium]
GGLEPDRAVLLDIPEAVAEGRLGKDLDRIEQRGPAYRAAVARALREIFGEDPERRRIVPATGDLDEVEARVWEAVRDLF